MPPPPFQLELLKEKVGQHWTGVWRLHCFLEGYRLHDRGRAQDSDFLRWLDGFTASFPI